MTVDHEPGLRERLAARLGPEPLAAVMTVFGLILFVLVLAVLVVGAR